MYINKSGKICLHSSVRAYFYPFTESDKDLLAKVRENMVGGLSTVFTRETVVDETQIRKSTLVCTSIVGIDPSQLYPYSMCQPRPTGLYTRDDFDAELPRYHLRQNKTKSFEDKFMSYVQPEIPHCRMESFYETGTQNKVDCFNADGFCGHCNTVFEAMGDFCPYCPCQEARLALTVEDIQCGTKMGYTAS